jgi:uncharacterized membrane protein HdeD (DUF308 family)
MSMSVEGFHAQVRKSAAHFIWYGAALLLIGTAALLFPVVSSLVAAIFVGWVLILSGVATLFGSFSLRGAGPFFGAVLLGLLSLAAGVFMLGRPIGGELAITLGLGVLFMVQGAFELVLAFELRHTGRWGWMLISALASIVFSLAILIGWPGTSLIVLGIIIGVNFISSGLAYIMMGSGARREAQG